MLDTTRLPITRLEPIRRHSDRMELYVAGELRCTVACDVLAAERLRVGTVLTAATLDRLMQMDAAWNARQSALSLLAARPRARGELVERLRRKGHDDSAIDAAIADIERLGYIDDVAFAESWVRDRLRLRPRGSRALVAELQRKGVAADVARTAVARTMAEAHIADNDLCLAAAARWARTRAIAPVDQDGHRKLERRLSAFLARRGYDMSAIRAAIAILSDGSNRPASAERHVRCESHGE